MKEEIILVTILILMGFAICGEPGNAQWYDDTDVLWLARAMVAEGGWHKRDHAAIGYVLVRKWERVSDRNPDVRLETIIRRYCSGLEADDRRTDRLRWVYRLDYGTQAPSGWPNGLPWLTYYPRWQKALQMAARVLRNGIQDPCRNRATDFGGIMDRPPERLERIDCGRTVNVFYRVRRNKNEIRP